MASAPKFTFDMIDSAGYGYHRVWQERAYLVRLAFIPLIIKFILTLCVYAFGYEDEILRRGLIMLPGALVQGWVLGQFLRTLMMEERWPMPLPKAGDELAISKLILRARGIISATLVYTLIALIVNVMGWGASLLDGSLQDLAAQQAAGTVERDDNPLFFFPALIMIGSLVMIFPLLWVYIPYAVLMPMKDYLTRVIGFLPSLKMFCVFLICMVPINVMASLFSYALVRPYGDTLDAAPAVIRFIMLLISVGADMITALIVTTGMAYALRDVVPRHPAALANVKS